MILPPVLRKFRHLSSAQRKLVAEALLMLAASSAGIRFLPFRRIAAAAARESSRRIAPEWDKFTTTRQIRWAVQATATMVPWRTVCFQKGLAAHAMLRRRGIPSVLHYGVRNLPEGGMGAHVWVCVDGQTVLGGAEAPAFACLATFPALS